MKQTAFQLSLLLPALFLTSLAYKWPNPQTDEVDHNLYDQFGYKGNVIFGAGVPNCAEFFGAPTVGRQTAAEWLRTAFHDMATHDAATGTGGMDGSIALEAGRAENAGRAINATVGFFLTFVTPNSGLADLIALGARVALDACGGPEIPYRAGRIDNLTPGPSGVPEPQQDLQTHTSAFSRMGFNQQEMIGLIACGHSIGGVHHQSFPTIVAPPPVPSLNSEGIQTFDSTFNVYDNKVATEFVAGTPNNPLAYGANITTNSDFRIFSSDGNATISSFAASQDTFFSTCANLFERMINTVPSGVTLTNIITPIPVKPAVYLDIQEDGSLNVFGEVRFFDMPDNSNRVVKFVWLDRNGQCAQGACSATASHDSGHVTTTVRNKQALWYSFSATVDSAKSISQFWFEVDEGNGSAPTQVKSENGSPFPIEDRLFILPSKSCDRSNGDDGTSTAAVNFAVRSGSQSVNPQIQQTIVVEDNPNQTYLHSTFTASTTLSSNSTSPNYQIYTATFGGKPFILSTYTLDIVAQIDGQEVKDIGWADTELATSPFNCPN